MTRSAGTECHPSDFGSPVNHAFAGFVGSMAQDASTHPANAKKAAPSAIDKFRFRTMPPTLAFEARRA
jgi:hypothetical protein